MEKEKKELKKEAVIALWNKACKEERDAKDFQIAGPDQSPYYILGIEDGISATVSAEPDTKSEDKHSYSMSVIFGEFVEYARFDLDKSEFDNLVNLFVQSHNNSINREVNRIVEDKEKRFFEMVKSCEV